MNPPDDSIKATRRRPRWRMVSAVCVIVSLVVGLLGVAAAAMFASGFVPLGGIERRVVAALEEQLGEAWSVRARTAGIARVDGVPRLEIRDVEFQHRSGIRFRSPEALVGYDPWALLQGRFDIRAVELASLILRVRVGADGALLISTDDPDAVASTRPAEPGRPPLVQFQEFVDTLMAGGGPFGTLDRVALRQARAVLLSPDGRERVGLQDVSITFDRSDDQVRLAMSGASASGVKEATVIASRQAAAPPIIDADVKSLQLADIAAVLFGDASLAVQGLPINGRIRIEGRGADLRLRGAVSLGAGAVRSIDGSLPSLGLDRLDLAFAMDGAARRLEVMSGRFEAGVTALDLTSAVATADDEGWRLEGSGRGTVAGEGFDVPVALNRAEFALSGVRAQQIRLERLRLEGPAISATVSGRLTRESEGPRVEAALEAGPSQARAAIAVWPVFVSPQVRTLVADRLSDGHLSRLTVAVDLPPAAFAAATAGAVIPDESVRVEVAGDGVAFKLGETLPPLKDAQVIATATGRTLDVAVASAGLELGQERQVDLSDGRFTIADTYADLPVGEANFAAAGDAEALAAALALPALQSVSPGLLDPDDVDGKFALKIGLKLPLIADLRASQVEVRANGELTEFQSANLVAPEVLSAGRFAIRYELGQLAMNGEARVAGIPSKIEMKQNARGEGEAVLTLTVDEAARRRRGLTLGDIFTGPAAVKLIQPLARGRKPPAKVEVNLQRVAIALPFPGTSKPAGRAGRLSFQIEKSQGRTLLNELVLDSAPLLARGSVVLSPAGDFVSASLTQFRLSPGDDLRLAVEKAGSGWKATVRGPVADARPLLRHAMGGGPAASRGSPEAMPDLDLDLAVTILTGFNNEAIGNAALRLERRDTALRRLEFAGRLGRAEVTSALAAQGGRQLVTLNSADGGGLLRFLDLYSRAHGGALAVTLRPDGERTDGAVRFENFMVRDEPALRRVLAEQGGETGRDSSSEVPFTLMTAGFSRSASRLTVREGVIHGTQVGVTAQGTVDFGRDRVDLAGTFVPGFSANRALSQVPIFGGLLTGGRNGGLFAVNFRVTGRASAPSMTINPLSAIAPGILRRFIDPLGGVPSGDLGATGPAPPLPLQRPSAR